MDTASAIHEDAGWYVDELVSTLVHTESGIQLIERWSVIAEMPLDELLLELSLDGVRYPPSGARPDSLVQVSGGELTDDRWPDSPAGRQVVGIRLATVLAPGELHDVDLTLGLAPSSNLGRHLYLPAVPCRRLELRLHFARSRAPDSVRVFAGLTAATISGDCPDGVAEGVNMLVDRVGEVGVTFHDLEPGLGYGVRWTPVAADAAGQPPAPVSGSAHDLRRISYADRPDPS